MDSYDYEERIEELMVEAFDRLDEGDSMAAIRIARQLEQLQHSSAYEILALAFADQGKRLKALRTLEKGVEAAPTVWPLWQLLGNYYSDEGRFQESEQAYGRALKCPEVDEPSVHLNFGIMLMRDARYIDALKHFNHVTSEEFKLAAIALRVETFNILEWRDQALDLARRALETYEDAQDQPEDLAKLHAECGLALWFSKQEREEAIEHAWQAIGLLKNEHTAMWLVRELTGEISPTGQYYQVTVTGVWSEPMEVDGEFDVPGFLASYEIVADSPEEALELARPFEPAEVRDSLSLEACEAVEPCSDQPKGVYAAPTEYAFFLRGDPDSR